MLTKAAAILGLIALLGAAPAKQNVGFSCTTLAHRQTLANAPGTTFRVLKMHFAANQPRVMHRHPFGEILYLLSGSGWNLMNGKKSRLSSDRAVVVPAGSEHAIIAGSAGTTLLSVQFADTASSMFHATKRKVPEACTD